MYFTLHSSQGKKLVRLRLGRGWQIPCDRRKQQEKNKMKRVGVGGVIILLLKQRGVFGEKKIPTCRFELLSC